MPSKDVVHHELGRQQTSMYNNSLTTPDNMLINSSSSNDSESMNLEEIIKSILLSDEPQTQTQYQYHPRTSSSSDMPVMQQPTFLQQDNTITNANWAQCESINGITRQGSIFSPLSMKTEDEFWEEIRNLEQQHVMMQNTNSNSLNPSLQHQETYGERETMTFEEFLVKNGAVELNPVHHHHHTLPATSQTFAYNPNNNSNCKQLICGPDVPGYEVMPSINDAGNTNSALLMEAAAILGVDPPQIGTSTGAGDTFDYPPLNAIQGDVGDENGNEHLERRGRKRKQGIIEDLPMEVVRERREQRMIKNRVSASRSRSRKQIHTLKIEAELAQLRAENATLKNQVLHLQQQYDEMRQKAQGNTQNPNGDLRTLRRSSSYPPSFM